MSYVIKTVCGDLSDLYNWINEESLQSVNVFSATLKDDHPLYSSSGLQRMSFLYEDKFGYQTRITATEISTGEWRLYIRKITK